MSPRRFDSLSATSFACWVLIIPNRNSRWFVCTPLNRKFRFPIELVLSVEILSLFLHPLSSRNRNFSLLPHRGIAVTFQLSSLVRAKKWFISTVKGRGYLDFLLRRSSPPRRRFSTRVTTPSSFLQFRRSIDVLILHLYWNIKRNGARKKRLKLYFLFFNK